MSGFNKILLVEDDPDINNIYTLILKNHGYDIRSVMDGKSALAEVLSFQPEVVLLDIMIPDIDGIAVLQTIRSAPEYSQIQPKVLIMSNLGKEEVKEDAKKYGAQGYVIKSDIVPSDLVTILEQLQTRADSAMDTSGA